MERFFGVGATQVGGDLEKRLEHEAAFEHARMRDGQARRVHNGIAEQQDVEIDCSRLGDSRRGRLSGGGARAAEIALD